MPTTAFRTVKVCSETVFTFDNAFVTFVWVLVALLVFLALGLAVSTLRAQ